MEHSIEGAALNWEFEYGAPKKGWCEEAAQMGDRCGPLGVCEDQSLATGGGVWVKEENSAKSETVEWGVRGVREALAEDGPRALEVGRRKWKVYAGGYGGGEGVEEGEPGGCVIVGGEDQHSAPAASAEVVGR